MLNQILGGCSVCGKKILRVRETCIKCENARYRQKHRRGYTPAVAACQKRYREKNKEKLAEYQRNYYARRKELK